MAITSTDSENPISRAVESNDLLNFLRGKGLSQADIEDVKQETALRILLISAQRGQEIKNAPAFVCTVAKNVIYEKWRSIRRTRVQSTETPLEEIIATHDANDAIFDDLSNHVRQALDDNERKLVDLLLMEKTLQELATVLRVSPAAVAQRKCRLKAKIEALLMSQTQLS